MVRLEKVIYEKAVNGLNRARAIGAPRKWYHSNPYEHLRRITYPTQSTTLTSWTELSSEKFGHPSPDCSPSSKCASTSTSSDSRDSHPKIVFCISTRHSGETSSSNMWPARRIFLHDEVFTPITGCSRPAEERDSAELTTQLLDFSSLSTFALRLSSKLMSNFCVCSQSGPTTCITTTILTWLPKPGGQ